MRRTTKRSSTAASADSTAAVDSAVLRSISTSIDCLASRTAAAMTSTATTSAATASADWYPAETNNRPTRTASEPARSEPKCSAFAASAAEPWRRDARWLTTMREASRAITNPRTAMAHHATSISCPPPSASRRAARKPMASDTSTRKALSPSAARCWALPWPYWWSSSAGRTATRTANSVSSAATRSVAEWAASARKASEPVARPVPSLTAIRTIAAPTLISAVRCWLPFGAGLHPPIVRARSPRDGARCIPCSTATRPTSASPPAYGRWCRSAGRR